MTTNITCKNCGSPAVLPRDWMGGPFPCVRCFYPVDPPAFQTPSSRNAEPEDSRALSTAPVRRARTPWGRRLALGVAVCLTLAAAAWLFIVSGRLRQANERVEKARVLLASGDPDGALRCLQEAIEIDPSSVDAQLCTGLAWERKGDWQKARSAYGEALFLEPGNRQALLARARAHCQAGDLPLAMNDYDALLKANPGDSTAVMERGVARVRAGDPSGAVSDLSKAIELNLESAEVYFQRASARQTLGDLDGAIADCKAATARGGEGSRKASLDLLVGLLQKRAQRREAEGNHEGARSDLQEANRFGATPPEAKQEPDRAATPPEPKQKPDPAPPDVRPESLDPDRDAIDASARAQWDRAQDAGDLVAQFKKSTSIQKTEMNRVWKGRVVRGSGPIAEVMDDPAFADISDRIELKIDLGIGRGYAVVYVPRSDMSKWVKVNRGEPVWFVGTVFRFEDALAWDNVIVEPIECAAGSGPPK